MSPLITDCFVDFLHQPGLIEVIVSEPQTGLSLKMFNSFLLLMPLLLIIWLYD